MKNKQLILAFIISVITLNVHALAVKAEIQDPTTLTVKAIFEGYDEEDGYVFLVKGEEDEDDDTIYFTEITVEALKQANLKSKDLIGKKFEVTYAVEEYEVEDEEGYVEVYEKYTITKLKQL